MNTRVSLASVPDIVAEGGIIKKLHTYRMKIESWSNFPILRYFVDLGILIKILNGHDDPPSTNV